MKPKKKVNRKTSGASPTKPPRSSGGIPAKSPHWVSLDRLCRGWVQGEEARTGKAGLLKKYVERQANRAKTSSYESACWGALNDCKMHDAARNLQMMVLDLRLPMRGLPDGPELYLGFVEDVGKATAYVAKQVEATARAIAAHRQRVNAKCSRAPAKAVKASPARAAKRIAPKRRPTRG